MLFVLIEYYNAHRRVKDTFLKNCFLKAWWPITLPTYLPLHLPTKEKNKFYAKKYSQFCHVDFDFTSE